MSSPDPKAAFSVRLTDVDLAALQAIDTQKRATPSRTQAPAADHESPLVQAVGIAGFFLGVGSVWSPVIRSFSIATGLGIAALGLTALSLWTAYLSTRPNATLRKLNSVTGTSSPLVARGVCVLASCATAAFAIACAFQTYSRFVALGDMAR